MSKYFENVKMLRLPFFEADAALGHVELEALRDVPFEIKRFFYIFGSGNTETVRGKHANRKSPLVLVNIAGTSKVKTIDENRNTRVYELTRPYEAVYLPKLVWKEMYDFSRDSILMILTNEYYDSNEYIRNFDDYVRIIKEES